MKELIKVLLIIIVIAFCFIFFYQYKERQIAKETILRTESEMRYKQLIIENKTIKAHQDSIKQRIDSLKSVIEIQSNNLRIIYKKNETNHNIIDNLDAYNAVKLFSTGIEDYSNKRQYYSLKRFNK